MLEVSLGHKAGDCKVPQLVVGQVEQAERVALPTPDREARLQAQRACGRCVEGVVCVVVPPLEQHRKECVAHFLVVVESERSHRHCGQAALVGCLAELAKRSQQHFTQIETRNAFNVSEAIEHGGVDGLTHEEEGDDCAR
eukprot:4443668-Prymnesium_polylepis.1